MSTSEISMTYEFIPVYVNTIGTLYNISLYVNVIWLTQTNLT